MGYLVDTNVFCESVKPRPNESVLQWLSDHERELHLSTITIAEIRRGIERLDEGKRKEDFKEWLSQINTSMKGNILGFNRSVAHVWGQMQGQLDRQGIRLAAFDGLIAATAVRYGLKVVTRNVKNFQLAPIEVVNPFPDTAD